jgi:hypothetical protein
MPTSEPFATALLLATAGALMGASVLFSRASQRIGVPIALLFLVIGMLAGSEGLGGIARLARPIRHSAHRPSGREVRAKGRFEPEASMYATLVGREIARATRNSLLAHAVLRGLIAWEAVISYRLP